MALQYSPKIVQDSLVMCLDVSQNTSYPAADLPVKNGLVMWMDAADDSTFSYSSGTTVTQWRDKSGLNNHMVPISAGPTRSSALNSRKVLAFTTAQTIGSITFNMETSANTVFVVSRYTSSSTNTNRALTAYYNNWLLGHWGSQVNKYYAEGWVYLTTVTADTVWRMYMGDWSGSSTDLASFYSNGTQLANGSAAATAGPKGLGINFQAGEPSTCEAAEIIVFNRVLSATERKQVHTYLGQKWGISNTDRSIVDLSNNNNNGLLGNGTVANMPTFNYYNKSLTYNKGESDTLVVTNSTSFKTNNITIELYMKFNSTISSNTGDYIQMGIGSGVGQFYFRNENPNLSWNWYPASSASSNLAYAISNFSTDTYYLITLTGDSAGASKMYVNGSQVASAANVGSGITTWTTNNLTIGGYVWDGYSNTDIALTRIYSRVLSSTEIAQNYEAQKSKFANTIVQQGLVLNLDAGNPYSYGGAGTTFYDVSPTALSWTINNATYNSSDPKYFSYNGSNSWLQSSTSAAYDSQTITMECWCYPNSLSQNGFLFEKGQVNTQYSMFFENPNFVFRTMGSVSNQSAYFTASTYLIVSVWNHIVCTYNGSSKIMYVNGIQVQSVAASGALPTGQTDQYIGRHSSGYFFNGRIGESRVYNIALSAAQVLQNYNATKGRFGL
jgi:hypothetical protein